VFTCLPAFCRFVFKFGKCRRGKIGFNFFAASSLSRGESELTLSFRSELGLPRVCKSPFLQPGELLEIYGRQLLRRAEYSAVGHVWDPKRYMDSQVGGAVSHVERNSITKWKHWTAISGRIYDSFHFSGSQAFRELLVLIGKNRITDSVSLFSAWWWIS